MAMVVDLVGQDLPSLGFEYSRLEFKIHIREVKKLFIHVRDISTVPADTNPLVAFVRTDGAIGSRVDIASRLGAIIELGKVVRENRVLCEESLEVRILVGTKLLELL